MKRLIVAAALVLAACGDSSDPVPSGPVVLTAEIRHTDPHPYTCEWRLTANADQLADPAQWLETSVYYSGGEDQTLAGYWLPARGIAPSEVQTGGWRGRGISAAWSATVVVYYEIAGRTDSATVTFDCD